jgi:hypothetical protein
LSVLRPTIRISGVDFDVEPSSLSAICYLM